MFKPLFHCQIEFYPIPHLSQIYDGFWKLKQKGIINLEVKRIQPKIEKPVIKVFVNNKHTLIYDTLDGLNWIDGNLEENLEYFKNNLHCDFYFKRSYSALLNEYVNERNIYPLGLNFPFDFEGDFPLTLMERLKSITKQKIKQKKRKLSTFEYPPIINPDGKILFLCGLWNPESANSLESRSHREKINTNRIDFIRKCKSEFGSQFTGGIQIDDYSKKIAKDILVPAHITTKRNFIASIKTHNICIATTGLHDSIGWKFAEYTTASRAIITEPLNYELPGDFLCDKNYLSFRNTSELINNIYSLLNDENKMHAMMIENYRYYNNYLDSEKLILNTLLKIKKA